MEWDYKVAKSAVVNEADLNRRAAFHEAGHAAAIHLRNRQKQLPSANFEIHLKKTPHSAKPFSAKIIDGNLFQNLPLSLLESLSLFSGNPQHSCQRAFEADIVNLLVGPLAEAKYVALRDDEVFNRNLINAAALVNYGGGSDMRNVSLYLESLIACREIRAGKLTELLMEAYNFIDNRQHWRKIEKLASYIVFCSQEIIHHDEIIVLLD